jgi:uracil-DNA glycosylase family 4
MSSLWQNHARKWSECTDCVLHTTRKHVVLARGSIPAQILFVGEAPGVSEDVIGQPFCGPAGQLLDRIIEMADVQLSIAFTNLVACLPLGDDGNKTAEPPAASIRACQPRLLEFIRLCNPKLIIAVGGLAAKHLPPSAFIIDAESPTRDFVSILHPAAVLRMDPVQQPLAIKRMVITISDVVSVLQST